MRREETKVVVRCDGCGKKLKPEDAHYVDMWFGPNRGEGLYRLDLCPNGNCLGQWIHEHLEILP